MKNAKYPKYLEILLDSTHKSGRDSKSKKSSQEIKFQLRYGNFSRGTVFFGTPCISEFKEILNMIFFYVRSLVWPTIWVINSCMMVHNFKSRWKNCAFQLFITSSVDGNWGAWSSYGKCSTTCGSGTQMRRRNCDRPSMSNGGKRCAGSATERRICSVRECPGTGIFSHYRAIVKFTTCCTVKSISANPHSML